MDYFLKELSLLSDKTRLRILNMLLKREVCVCELRDVLKISQPAVSKHIKKLKEIDLVRERQAGYWSYYSINLKNHSAVSILEFIMKKIKEEKIFKDDMELLNMVSCIEKGVSHEIKKAR